MHFAGWGCGLQLCNLIFFGASLPSHEAEPWAEILSSTSCPWLGHKRKSVPATEHTGCGRVTQRFDRFVSSPCGPLGSIPGGCQIQPESVRFFFPRPTRHSLKSAPWLPPQPPRPVPAGARRLGWVSWGITVTSSLGRSQPMSP